MSDPDYHDHHYLNPADYSWEHGVNGNYHNGEPHRHKYYGTDYTPDPDTELYYYGPAWEASLEELPFVVLRLREMADSYNGVDAMVLVRAADYIEQHTHGGRK